MPVSVSLNGRTMTALVSGEIDHHGAREIMDTLEREINTSLPKSLELDLSGVTFMDSSGIAVLLRAHRRLSELDGQITVHSIPPQPRKVLDAAGVGRIITLQ